MARYAVLLHTGTDDGAGTNADVAIELRGQFGSSGPMLLDLGTDDHPNGQEDLYVLPELRRIPGRLSSVRVFTKRDDDDRPDWQLADVCVIDGNRPNNQEWQFDYNGLIKIESKTKWSSIDIPRSRDLGAAPAFDWGTGVAVGAPPISIPGTSSSPLSIPTARTANLVSRSADHLDAFCVGTDGHVYTAAWEPAFTDGFRGWWRIGSISAVPGSPVGVVSRAANKMDVFAVDSSGAVQTAAWEPNRGGWRGWWPVPGVGPCPAARSAWSRAVRIIWMRSVWGRTGMCTRRPGTPPSPTGSAAGGGSVRSLRCRVVRWVVSRAANKMDVFAVDSSGAVQTAAWEPNRGGWRGWWPVAGGRTVPGGAVSVVSRSADHLDAFCVGTDGHVYTAAWEPAFTDGFAAGGGSVRSLRCRVVRWAW